MTSYSTIRSPYPYFGGKQRIAPLIWERLGGVTNYVEPFFGSGATLLARPEPHKGTETVNDIDANIANWWRAVKAEPDAIASLVDWPISEPDLIARHIWLVNTGSDRADRVQADPDYYDVQAAAWWCWGLCCWIGSGWCSGKGPWNSDGEKLINLRDADGGATEGVSRQLPRLAPGGRGVTQNAATEGVSRQLPHLSAGGQGVTRATATEGISRQLPYLSTGGRGVTRATANEFLADWMDQLSRRLRGVRVACGDWKRVLGKSVRFASGKTCGVLLDPPYSTDNQKRAKVYSNDASMSDEVQAWALEYGADPNMRIALCGYDGEYDLPDWDCIAWKAGGGMANSSSGNDNCHKERVWFSPYCVPRFTQPDIKTDLPELSLFSLN